MMMTSKKNIDNCLSWINRNKDKNKIRINELEWRKDNLFPDKGTITE